MLINPNKCIILWLNWVLSTVQNFYSFLLSNLSHFPNWSNSLSLSTREKKRPLWDLPTYSLKLLSSLKAFWKAIKCFGQLLCQTIRFAIIPNPQHQHPFASSYPVLQVLSFSSSWEQQSAWCSCVLTAEEEVVAGHWTRYLRVDWGFVRMYVGLGYLTSFFLHYLG